MTVPPGSTDSSSCQQCTVPPPFFARLRCCYTLPVTRLVTHTPTERAAIVTAPTLVMNGGASYAFMYDTAQALGKAIPNARVRTLEGQTHNVDSDVLAPVLMEFFSG